VWLVYEHMFVDSDPGGVPGRGGPEPGGRRPARSGPRAAGPRAVPADLAARVRPVVAARQRLLPVLPALVPLFADGALQRGTTTVVAGRPGHGARTLALSLLAEASRRGSWCAVVGADPGVAAMAELGLALERVALIRGAVAAWPEVCGELLRGVDVVLVQPPGPVRITVARHLTALARERAGALVVLAGRAGDWCVGPDLALTVSAGTWAGMEAEGQGHLRARRVAVHVGGRRASGRETVHQLYAPAPSGAVAVPDA
jgi:hypothetical protein